MDQVRNWSIYKITNPRGHVYIGKTCNLKKRKSHYQQLECENQRILYKSLLKYGFKAHSFEIIDNFTSNVSYSAGKEIFWIKTYMSHSKTFPEMNGMNITPGGQGTIGRIVSDELKAKYREQNSKYRHTDEAKKRIGEAAKGNKYSVGRKHTAEWKKAHSERIRGNKNCLGKKQSAERIEHRVSQIRGKKMRQECIGRMRVAQTKSRGKPIVQMSLKGDFIREYLSCADAARYLNLGHEPIRRAAIGRSKYCGGFTFKYKQT